MNVYIFVSTISRGITYTWSITPTRSHLSPIRFICLVRTRVLLCFDSDTWLFVLLRWSNDEITGLVHLPTTVYLLPRRDRSLDSPPRPSPCALHRNENGAPYRKGCVVNDQQVACLRTEARASFYFLTILNRKRQPYHTKAGEIMSIQIITGLRGRILTPLSRFELRN